MSWIGNSNGCSQNYGSFSSKGTLPIQKKSSLNVQSFQIKFTNHSKTWLTYLRPGIFSHRICEWISPFAENFEHEIHLLKKNNIRREMHMAYLKLPEEYIKKNDFKHWSDAGREWREVVLQGTILNRYLDRKNNRILYEDFFAHGAVLLRQSRHIRHNEVGSKNQKWWADFFIHSIRTIICPSCGATVTLTSDEDHCPYCGGYIKSDFFDWQTEEFLIYRDYNPNTRNFKLTAATMIAFFIPAIPCFRFILPHSYFLALGSAFVITALLAPFTLAADPPKNR